MIYKFLVCFILIFNFFEIDASDLNKKYEKLYLKGNEFFKIGEFKEAIIFYNKSIKLNPTYCQAIYKLGISYKKTFEFNNFLNAFLLYEKLACTKFIDDVRFQMGEYYFFNGEINLAKRFFESIDEKKNFSTIEKYLRNINYTLTHRNDSSLFKISDKSFISSFVFQYSPHLNSSSDRLYFTARKGTALLDDENIFYVDKENLSNWGPPKILKGKINSANNEGSISLTSDSKFIVYTSCELNFKKNSCDLFFLEMINGVWTQPRKMSQNVNSEYWDSQPNISHDGNILFFVSNRPGGKGGRDIWYSTRENLNSWSPAKNLSDKINSKYDEVSPFISDNMLDFYFSSNKISSYGGFDVYRAHNFNLDFENIINLGYTINNHLDQSSFIINDDIIVYTEEDKLMDFVKSKLIIGNANYSIKRKSNYYNSIIVMDSVTRDKLSPSILIRSKSNERDTLVINSRYSGKINFKKEKIQNSDILFSLNGYEPKIISLDKNDLDSIIYMKPLNEAFVLENIYFDFNKYSLNKDVRKYLDLIHNWILNNQNLRIEIGGHTDSVGTEEYNMELSIKRAFSVYNYLTLKGDVKNLLYKGYGNKIPISKESDGYKNRRIEFKLF